MPFNASKYQAAYAKEKLRRFELRVNRENEPDLMGWLESKENLQQYLKQLIRKDMEESKPVKTWWIIDDKGDIFTEDTRTSIKAEAAEMARTQWEHLTKAEQEHRKDFYIALAFKGEDGQIDWNTVTEAISLKHRHMVQFESGPGRTHPGTVNYLICLGLPALYAEIPVPDDAEEDYGYLNLKDKILEQAENAGIDPLTLEFWYDGQEQYLSDQARI